jgi:hypothetical protein
MKPWRVLIVCSLVLACRTSTFTAGEVAVLEPLAPAEVEAAIIAAILEVPTPRLTPAQRRAVSLSEDAARSYFGDGYNAPAPRRRFGGWFLQERRPGMVTAGFRARTHYLVLGIGYDRSGITTEILLSENLKQDGDEIHSNAIKWIRDLEGRMSIALATVSR